MEIRDSARKHGIADEDIEHAVRHYIYTAALEAETVDRFLYIGPDTAGNLLEVAVLEPSDGSQTVVHAMKLRRRYEERLR